MNTEATEAPTVEEFTAWAESADKHSLRAYVARALKNGFLKRYAARPDSILVLPKPGSDRRNLYSMDSDEIIELFPEMLRLSLEDEADEKETKATARSEARKARAQEAVEEESTAPEEEAEEPAPTKKVGRAKGGALATRAKALKQVEEDVPSPEETKEILAESKKRSYGGDEHIVEKVNALESRVTKLEQDSKKVKGLLTAIKESYSELF